MIEKHKEFMGIPPDSTVVFGKQPLEIVRRKELQSAEASVTICASSTISSQEIK